jgi:hypothetical protein
MVDVHCNDAVTDAERVEIDAWVDMHGLDDIDTAVVGARVVAVHARARATGVTGTSERRGNVIAELNTALDMLRKLRGNP